MPAGSRPGEPRRGGRVKGTKNRDKALLADRMTTLGCDVFAAMALIVTNRLPCGVCRGAGKTKFQASNGQHGERTCQSCYGSKLERCSPELRGKMAAELAQYLEPKRKAIEVTGEGGGPIQTAHRIVFVAPK